MANTTQNNAVKPNVFVRIGNWFKGLGSKIVTSLREMVAELKKVAWPSKKELLNYTLVVVGFMVAMGIIIGLIDAGAGALVNLIVG